MHAGGGGIGVGWGGGGSALGGVGLVAATTAEDLLRGGRGIVRGNRAGRRQATRRGA